MEILESQLELITNKNTQLQLHLKEAQLQSVKDQAQIQSQFHQIEQAQLQIESQLRDIEERKLYSSTLVRLLAETQGLMNQDCISRSLFKRSYSLNEDKSFMRIKSAPIEQRQGVYKQDNAIIFPADYSLSLNRGSSSRSTI